MQQLASAIQTLAPSDLTMLSLTILAATRSPGAAENELPNQLAGGVRKALDDFGKFHSHLIGEAIAGWWQVWVDHTP